MVSHTKMLFLTCCIFFFTLQYVIIIHNRKRFDVFDIFEIYLNEQYPDKFTMIAQVLFQFLSENSINIITFDDIFNPANLARFEILRHKVHAMREAFFFLQKTVNFLYRQMYIILFTLNVFSYIYTQNYYISW